MNVKEAEKTMAERLVSRFGEGEATAIARLYLEQKLPDASRLRNTDLADSDTVALFQDLERIQNGEPVQYVLQTAHFYGLDLYVDPAVLIPRSETEELVHWIIQDSIESFSWLNSAAAQLQPPRMFKIMDVGTGSGCIALALKKNLPAAEVWGCDRSEDALAVARRNGSELDIRVDFQGVDFLSDRERRQLPNFDIIVSNPPYIPHAESRTLSEHVLHHEPHLALFVPDHDPMLFYRSLAEFGRHHLDAAGCLYMEIHESHGSATCEVFHHYGYTKIELRKDMQGKDRMLKVGK